MAELDKTYPLAFSALAFLQPKHLDPAKLFNEDDDDETLRRLKPAPETVRAAILACKKYGFRVSYSDGLSLSLSGPSYKLLERFGVRFAGSAQPENPQYWFEKEDGQKVFQLSPRHQHPLSAAIATLVLLFSHPHRRPICGHLATTMTPRN
jgi:hypothetical protein